MNKKKIYWFGPTIRRVYYLSKPAQKAFGINYDDLPEYGKWDLLIKDMFCTTEECSPYSDFYTDSLLAASKVSTESDTDQVPKQ